MYILVKNCAMYQAVMKESGIVVFSSLNRKRVKEFIEANTEKELQSDSE